MPMIMGNLFHVASKEAIQDFWHLDIDYSKGGGLIILEKNQVKWEGDEQYHFVALFEGGGSSWEKVKEIKDKAKKGEIV